MLLSETSTGNLLRKTRLEIVLWEIKMEKVQAVEMAAQEILKGKMECAEDGTVCA